MEIANVHVNVAELYVFGDQLDSMLKMFFSLVKHVGFQANTAKLVMSNAFFQVRILLGQLFQQVSHFNFLSPFQQLSEHGFPQDG